MAERKAKSTTPTRVLIGPLKTATQVRTACRRIGQGVLDGKIAPKVANSALYAIAGAKAALELETAERLSRQLETIQGQQELYPALSHQPAVIEGEVVAQ